MRGSRTDMYVFIQVVNARARATSVSRAVLERLVRILYFCRRICGRESLGNADRRSQSRSDGCGTTICVIGQLTDTSTLLTRQPEADECSLSLSLLLPPLSPHACNEITR